MPQVGFLSSLCVLAPLRDSIFLEELVRYIAPYGVEICLFLFIMGGRVEKARGNCLRQIKLKGKSAPPWADLRLRQVRLRTPAEDRGYIRPSLWRRV